MTCRRRRTQASHSSTKKQTATITDDEITTAVIEGIPNMASSNHDHVCAVTEKPRLGNQAVRWKKPIVLLTISVVQESVSALQVNDVSWVLLDSGSAVTACPPTQAQEVPIIRGPETVLTLRHEANQLQMRPSNNNDDQVGRRGSLVLDCVRQSVDDAKQSSGLLRGQPVHRDQEREEDGAGGAKQRLSAEMEDFERWSGQHVAVRHG